VPESHLRAADTDRTRVAAVLGEHMSAGRLSVEEYDDRLARAYTAKTYGELDQLTADLPSAPAVVAPLAGGSTVTAPAGDVQGWAGGPTRAAAWRSWAVTALIVLTVWVASMIGQSELTYPWPIWVIGPWGAVLLGQSLTRGTPTGHPQLHGRNRDRRRSR